MNHDKSPVETLCIFSPLPCAFPLTEPEAHGINLVYLNNSGALPGKDGCAMRFRRQGNVMTVDLHGLYEAAARGLLLNWLDHAPEGVRELRVIHGCNQGVVLRDMVRHSLRHRRLTGWLPALNPGETRLLLR